MEQGSESYIPVTSIRRQSGQKVVKQAEILRESQHWRRIEMFWNNLSVAANYFVEIAVELTVLFIGITFLVGLIQEYVSDETIKKAMGGTA